MAWLRASLEDDLSKPIEPKTLTVELKDESGTVRRGWTLSRAWPVKWRIDAIWPGGDTIAIQSVELAYSDVQRDL